MLSSSLRTTFGTAALFICGCLNLVSTAFAEDLSVEEFIEYSTRRVTGVSPEVINQFAKAVDENSDPIKLISNLLEIYGTSYPNHPMTKVLIEGMKNLPNYS